MEDKIIKNALKLCFAELSNNVDYTNKLLSEIEEDLPVSLEKTFCGKKKTDANKQLFIAKFLSKSFN